MAAARLGRRESGAGKAALANVAEWARAEDRSLLDYLAIIRSSLFRVFMDASKKNDRYNCALLSSRLTAVLELTARVTGELRDAATAQGVNVNILNATGGAAHITSDSEVARVQACVIRALRVHP